jgi:hypothetical protein
MDFTGEFAKQGLGYLIAAVEGLVIIWLFKRLDDKYKDVAKMQEEFKVLQEKRVVESREYANGFIGLGKDITNGMEGLKEAQLSFTRFIEKIPIKS